jgi:hypothetical protein
VIEHRVMVITSLSALTAFAFFYRRSHMGTAQ